MTLRAVQDFARQQGLLYGVDLAARDSATLGGTVATNAGGVRAVAYGMTRSQVVGIEAVFPGGRAISRLRGILKDNSGYDLAQLLCGSEGTLGVVSRVRLQLRPAGGASSVALIGVRSLDEAVARFRAARNGSKGSQGVLAAEILDAVSMGLAVSSLGRTYPLRSKWPFALLLEVSDGGTAEGLGLSDEDDCAVAVDSRDAADLWRLREELSEVYTRLGAVKLDIAVPLAKLGAFAGNVKTLLASADPAYRLGLFGHVGDGNLHIQVTGGNPARVPKAAILQLVADMGGAISAEHGIGRQKAELIHLSRSEPDIVIMRSIKDALDPRGIMNPGVLWAKSAI